jgi:hypothetical protein
VLITKISIMLYLDLICLDLKKEFLKRTHCGNETIANSCDFLLTIVLSIIYL